VEIFPNLLIKKVFYQEEKVSYQNKKILLHRDKVTHALKILPHLYISEEKRKWGMLVVENTCVLLVPYYPG
jgi:hypothetical protein